MGDAQQAGDLQVPEDLDFEQRSWRVERVGWVILSLIMTAAFVGLLGDGPISAATAGAEGTTTAGAIRQVRSPPRTGTDGDQAAAGCCAR